MTRKARPKLLVADQLGNIVPAHEIIGRKRPRVLAEADSWLRGYHSDYSKIDLAGMREAMSGFVALHDHHNADDYLMQVPRALIQAVGLRLFGKRVWNAALQSKRGNKAKAKRASIIASAYRHEAKKLRAKNRLWTRGHIAELLAGKEFNWRGKKIPKRSWRRITDYIGAMF